MPQLSIGVPDIAYAGQLAEPGAPTFTRKGIVEGAAIAAGAPLKRGTAAQSQVKNFEAGDTPSAAMFAGFCLLDPSRAYDSAMIAVGQTVSVLRTGSLYLNFSEAVTAGEQVGLVLATGLLTGIPHGTAAGAIATGTVVLPCCRIVDTTTAAGMATVEVNLFGAQDAATVGSL